MSAEILEFPPNYAVPFSNLSNVNGTVTNPDTPATRIAASLSSWQTGLSVQQLQAVMHGEGHAFVNATYGSGKTHLLTKRHDRLSLQHPDVVTLAFNVAAAKECRERVLSQFAENIYTIDALALRRLQEFRNSRALSASVEISVIKISVQTDFTNAEVPRWLLLKFTEYATACGRS